MTPDRPNSVASGARVTFSGKLQYKDANGNVLKMVDARGSLPLEDTGLTIDQAKALFQPSEDSNVDLRK